MRQFLLLCTATVALSGCGAHTQGDSHGDAAFSVLWPTPSRLVPAGAKSAAVTLSGAVLPQPLRLTTNRPADGSPPQPIRFSNLAAGTYQVTVTTHPERDGIGTAQSVGADTVAIQPGQVTSKTVTMGSTIVTAGLVPESPTVIAGNTVQLGVSFKNAQGELVLVDASAVEWSSSSPIVTVGQDGLVTAIATGATKVAVTDRESGKAAFSTVTVTTPDPGQRTKLEVAGGPVSLGVELPMWVAQALDGTVISYSAGRLRYYDAAWNVLKTVQPPVTLAGEPCLVTGALAAGKSTERIVITDPGSSNRVFVYDLDGNQAAEVTGLVRPHGAHEGKRGKTVLFACDNGVFEASVNDWRPHKVLDVPCTAVWGDGYYIGCVRSDNGLYQVYDYTGRLQYDAGDIGLIYAVFSPPGHDLVILALSKTVTDHGLMMLDKAGNVIGYSNFGIPANVRWGVPGPLHSGQDGVAVALRPGTEFVPFNLVPR
jgi:hypothetical protein